MPRTVLVADDSPTVTRKVEGILKGEGLDVKTVSNGVAAIKKLPQIKPLLILADGAMPGKDGYEVCDFVKNSPDLSHVPVLLVYSDMEPYDEQRGARVRADGRIKKPFDPEELIATVAKFLAQSEAAAPKPKPAATVVAAPPPEPSIVLEPVDEEPQIVLKGETPDFGALSGGVAFAEPALEETPAAAPEYAPPPGAEPMMEAEISTEAMPAVEIGAPAEEQLPAPAAEETPMPAEPVLVEEPAAAAPEPPPAERTVMFRAPAQIAEPVLSDELAAAVPPPVEAPPRLTEPEAPPRTASTLDSFSLTEAASGQVQFVPPGAEVVPESEAVAEAPAAALAVDANLIYSIVHRAVVRMSPPALSPQMIEEMARNLADEIAAELRAESSQS